MKRIFKKLVFISAVSGFGLLVGGLDGVQAQQLEKEGSYQKSQATASKTEVRIHSKLAQSSWPTGYYKLNSNDAVYWLNASEGTHCVVQNPSQMKMFGGFIGDTFMMWVMDLCHWVVQVVLRPNEYKGFVLLKKVGSSSII
jgi:hypothetical protein